MNLDTLSRTEFGRLFREACQAVFISSDEGWFDISAERRERHCQAGDHLRASLKERLGQDATTTEARLSTLIAAVLHFYACERLDSIDRIAADFDAECDQQYEDLMAAVEAAKGEPVGAEQ